MQKLERLIHGIKKLSSISKGKWFIFQWRLQYWKYTNSVWQIAFSFALLGKIEMA